MRTESTEAVTRRLVKPSASRFGRQWYPLRIAVPEAGAARVEFTTRPAHGGTNEGCALWGNPRLEVPRPLSDFAAPLRSAAAAGSLRGMWQRVLPVNPERLYRQWVRENEPSGNELRAQRELSAEKARAFALITYVADPACWSPQRTAQSLLEQSYPRWEWIVAVPEASIDETARIVARLTDDRRVRVCGVPTSSTKAEAWNAALQATTGEFAALLDSGDVLAPSALYEMATALDGSAGCDVVYSDEDQGTTGVSQRHTPRFKPDWSPELLLAFNYVGRLAMFRIATVLASGGFSNGFGDQEEWEMFLRLRRAGARFRRVPRCLYHRHESVVPSRHVGTEAVLKDHCDKVGWPADVTASELGTRIVWGIRDQPTVSIIIPNRNAAAMLTTCIAGLLRGTSYPRVDIVIVDNESSDADVLELYRSLERDGSARIVPFNRPFNFSAACNAGAAAARGDFLLFLNNDIEVIQRDWLEELVGWAQQPEVGIVGAKLLYPDRTIQHAGVVFGLGLVGHIFSRAREDAAGVFGSAGVYRNYLAVTGACQMMRRDVFERLGGYDERFRLSFSDVVLCMEAWRAELRVVYTPHARLIHHESYTRKREDSLQDMELLARYLRTTGFVEDPYLHPELNAKSLIPMVATPSDPAPRQVVRDYVERVLAGAAARSQNGQATV